MRCATSLSCMRTDVVHFVALLFLRNIRIFRRVPGKQTRPTHNGFVYHTPTPKGIQTEKRSSRWGSGDKGNCCPPF
jgi:hypothetical protein